MDPKMITENRIADFEVYLKTEEKSRNTIEKYLRDVRAFAAYAGGAEVTKERVIAYKNKLLADRYAARSVNSLRHLFARTFYSLEKDIAKLADILGHSSINTTRIYVTSTGTKHRRRMENLHSNAFFGLQQAFGFFWQTTSGFSVLNFPVSYIYLLRFFKNCSIIFYIR